MANLRSRRQHQSTSHPAELGQSASSLAQFDILKLPSELRDHVYRLYLEDFYGSLPVRLGIANENMKKLGWISKPIKLPDLFFVSHQAYSEAWRIVFSCSIVRIVIGIDYFYKVQCDPTGDGEYCTWSRYTRKALQTTCHLRVGIWAFGDCRTRVDVYVPKDFSEWTRWFQDVSEIVEMFASASRKDALRARALNNKPVQRTLHIDFGHIFRLCSLNERSTAAIDWNRALALMDDTMLTARAGGEEDVLGLRAFYVSAVEEDSRMASVRFRSICEKYYIPWTEMSYQGR